MRQRSSKGLPMTESRAGGQPGSGSIRCGTSGLGGESHANGANGADRALSLTQRDRSEFVQCEGIIGRGLSTFFEVGSALLTIREKRLYRGAHQTFEMYCRERWGIGRSYAWRLIGAAERLNLLPAGEGLIRPLNEFQIRPFLKLAPEAFPQAWQNVTERAKDGKVTLSMVQGVICELSSNGTCRTPPARKAKRSKPINGVQLGQILALIQEARRNVDKHDSEKVLAALQNIEDLLFEEP